MMNPHRDYQTIRGHSYELSLASILYRLYPNLYPKKPARFRPVRAELSATVRELHESDLLKLEPRAHAAHLS